MSTTELKGTVKLCEDTGAVLTINKPITIGYIPSAITANTIGYSIKYNFAGGGGTLTLASFTNSPIGIYLLTVGPTTVFDFGIGANTATSERADITFTTTTGIESFTTFNTMETSGTAAEKYGVCFTMPIRVINATNQLTINLVAVTGGYNTTGGSSCMTRIA